MERERLSASRRRRSLRQLSCAATLSALVLAIMPHEAAAQETNCAPLARPGQFANTVVSSAQMVAPNPTAKTPAYCEITAVISPVPRSRIGVIFRLPTTWNGKLLGYGGGGWAGNVRLTTAADGLARGYATLQTDGGHPSPNGGDATWTSPGGKVDEVALSDFAWRAVHTMTEIGEHAAHMYYGRRHDKAYFQGCSTGGRMALIEAQRFPDDYDAIISGAPVYNLRTQLAEIYRDWIFAQPGAAITSAQIALVHDAVLASCDITDGVGDGVVGDPKACGFDPAILECKAGQSGNSCLTSAQVTAFRRQYEEVKGTGGITNIFPYTRGSEPGWSQYTNVTADPVKAAAVRNLDLRAAMFGDPNFDFAKFDPVRDTTHARSENFAKYYEADNPDIRPFLAKGGKLILWHGLDDPAPSPWGTVDYYERVQKAVGPQAASSVRLFLAPGVRHCGGGPGANTFDLLAPLDEWVKHGTAPDRISARRVAPPETPLAPMSRPLCAYPARPSYVGNGDVNDERSFVCR